MNLYEIRKDYEFAFAVIDESDGELTPAMIARLDALEGELAVKAEATVRSIRSQEALAAACAEEAAKIAARGTAVAARAKRLEGYLVAAMRAAQADVVRAGVFTLRVANNPASVRITDERKIPTSFLCVKTSEAPDKRAIKAAIDLGHEVPGACLERTERLVIK